MATNTGDNSKNLTNDYSNTIFDTITFKKALSTCMRAIAGTCKLEVFFGHNRPSLSENRARLPELSQHSTNKDIEIARGLGDSMALRTAWHNGRIHTQFVPQEPEARAIFEALEQTRVEAIGALKMKGIAQNLDSMLADKYQRAGYQNISTQDEAPIEEAIALLLREKITKRPPPKESGPVLDLWRQEIEQKASAELNELTNHIYNQPAFAQIVRKMLIALNITVQLEEISDGENNKKLKNQCEPQNQTGEERSNEKKNKAKNKQQQIQKVMSKIKEKRKQHSQMTAIKPKKNKIKVLCKKNQARLNAFFLLQNKWKNSTTIKSLLDNLMKLWKQQIFVLKMN